MFLRLRRMLEVVVPMGVTPRRSSRSKIMEVNISFAAMILVQAFGNRGQETENCQ